MKAKTLKQIEEEMTPMECVDEIISCTEDFYSEENGTRLPKELHEYSGYISIIYKMSKLLKKKLS